MLRVPGAEFGDASRWMFVCGSGVAEPSALASIVVARVTVGVSFEVGFAGKVENGPSWIERLLGGLPLNFPEPPLALDGQALETAGTCLRFARLGDLVDEIGLADLGSSKPGLAE